MIDGSFKKLTLVQWKLHHLWNQMAPPGFRAPLCQLLVGTHWECPIASLASVSSPLKSGLRYLPHNMTLRRLSEIIEVNIQTCAWHIVGAQ